MRAAAILGLGCSPRDLKPFQSEKPVEWQMGIPASADQVDLILLFGGDGTIHRHLGPLVRLGVPVLVVPVGSGNDFARALGLRRVRDSLEAWTKFCGGSGHVRALDLGVISETGRAGEASAPHYFCCVAGVGLDGEVSRRANELPRWVRGNGGYVLSLLPTIFQFAPLRMKIMGSTNKLVETESPSAHDAGWITRSDQPTLLAAFANTAVYGGGMKIAPRAKMDDGLLDICIVCGVNPFRLLRLFPTVYTGSHLGIREVEYFQSARVRVETEHPIDVYADGEYVCRTPIEVAAQASVLKVVTLALI